MSKRLSPAERPRAEIDEVFAGGEDLAGAIEEVARLGARLLLQTAIEAEVSAFLGRERYQRASSSDDARVGIEHRKAAPAAPHHDRWIGRRVHWVFVHRGQPIGRRYLFEDALETACTRAGLVDANGKPTVTAHRFRHTVGAQLAEGGARIQTIMAILDHRSAGMAVTYSHISDPVLKEQYERVIANSGRVAGPAAEALLNNQIGQETLDWLKSNYFKTELELGHCLRLPAEGPCECDLYLRCSKFFTTSEYAPRLRERLARQRELIQDATERNWPREIERHEATSRRIRELLSDLGEPCDAFDGQSE